ncbi:unnamed protein product [Effrenium voratum]|uniref:M23ase beta-sheet core domain-containing protein n=1 Tax=Effrenium voratum TaxID=2562239 RepID=A0AA36HKF5_9DINO|nr:unnamed protein product [Effrenium voratum]CAJ1434135.1 unnamed protein product [Effrenium voratum]
MRASRSPRAARPRGGDWPGCHVAHGAAPWILGLQDLQSAGFESEDLPDISIDPEDKVLSVFNSTEEERCYCLSLAAAARGRAPLRPGQARKEDGSIKEIIAFVLVLPAKSVMDVCKLRGPAAKDVLTLELQSDIVTLQPPPPLLAGFSYGFPLAGGPFLCSQGHGGKLTHFAHPSTFYALDFDCPVGTAVLAMEDGTVTEVRQSDTVSGIDVRNFFKWNQVTVKQSDGTWAEYVHVEANSAQVGVGSQVRRGQVLARSGDVGFCPTAHLHVELHLSDEPKAPSVPFGFRTAQGEFRCEEGKWYAAEGECERGAAPEHAACVFFGQVRSCSVAKFGPSHEATSNAHP